MTLQEVEKKRTLLRGDRDNLRALINLLSDTLTKRGQRAFRNAVLNAASGDFSQGWDDLTIRMDELDDIYQVAFARAGRAESAILGQFDIKATNPRAVSHLRRESSTLITNIDEQSREAVRVVLSRGAQGGLQPEQLVSRVRRVVGLTPRDALAAENLRRGLLNSGANPSRVERTVNAYKRRLLDARALTIARTETTDAIESARQAVWEQAVAAGLVARNAIWRVWVTHDDERVCPVCAPLDGARSRLGGTFTKGGQSQLRPPAHPNCRCHIAYEVLGFRVQKHAGPGNHPGTGTPQTFHSGQSVPGGVRPDPMEPGTRPIPEGYVRLYHYTHSLENLDNIVENGIQRSSAKGDTYGEPNVIWASTRQPGIDSAYVEFAVPFENIVTDDWRNPDSLRPVVGGPYNSDKYSAEEWGSGTHDLGFGVDVIPPSMFVSVNRPHDNYYRAIVNDPHYRARIIDDSQGFLDEFLGISPETDRAFTMAVEDIISEGVQKHKDGDSEIHSTGTGQEFHNPHKKDKRVGAPQRKSNFVRPDGKPMARDGIGDTYEDLLLNIGFATSGFIEYSESSHYAGKGSRNAPIDLTVGVFAIEVKTVHSSSKTWKATIKGHELVKKYRAAAELQKRPATVVQVVHPDRVDVHFFSDEFASRSVKTRTPDFSYRVSENDFWAAYERQGHGGRK